LAQPKKKKKKKKKTSGDVAGGGSKQDNYWTTKGKKIQPTLEQGGKKNPISVSSG